MKRTTAQSNKLLTTFLEPWKTTPTGNKIKNIIKLANEHQDIITLENVRDYIDNADRTPYNGKVMTSILLFLYLRFTLKLSDKQADDMLDENPTNE